MKTSANIEAQMLSQNIGFHDRQVRAAIGTLMIIAPMLAVSESLGNWSIVMLASIPVLMTAITGWDPLYAVTGLSTYEGRAEDIQQRHWSYANIGIIDRGIRLGAGLMMLSALMTMTSMTGGMALSLLAIPLVVTAIIAWDPIYAVMGINSLGSRLDVKAAEPETSDRTLAIYYELPRTRQQPDQLARAA
jgi:hypothetical protein